MGLDISLIKNIRKVSEEEYEENDYEGFYAYQAEESWHDRCPNIEVGAHYLGDFVRGEYPGYSYGSHNRFREFLLFELAGLDQFRNYSGGNPNEINWDLLCNTDGKDIPFYKLINFSDCEGTMDWECAAELLPDFMKNKEKVDKMLSDDPMRFGLTSYHRWINVLQDAIDNKGVILFR